jgi:hypothetical protein
MASNLYHPEAFVFLLLMLMVLDIVWVLSFLPYKELVFVEWLHYDSFIAFFVLTILLTSIQLTSIQLGTYVLIFAVLVARPIADYKSLWKEFWAKFPLPS